MKSFLQSGSRCEGLPLLLFGVSSVKASEEDEEMIKNLQRTAVMRDPTMAAATLTGAQADAMKAPAANPNAGPFMAFAGMNMAANTGGMNAQDLFAMGQQYAAKRPAQDTQGESWICACGKTGNTGKFCMECGKPRPETDGGWNCPGCGTYNKGKFCAECGKPKPEGAKAYKCDKCGWEPEDKTKPPKFCPECGDPFNDSDVQ